MGRFERVPYRIRKDAPWESVIHWAVSTRWRTEILRSPWTLFSGLHADQITVIVNIPYGNRVRGGVNVGPAVVRERLGQLVDVPLPGVLLLSDFQIR